MEQSNTAPAAAPGNLKTLVILSYIGNAIWSVIFIIGMVASGWFMSFLGGKMDEATDKMKGMEGMEGVSAEEMEAATQAAGGMMAMGTGILIGICAFFLLLQVLCMLGVSKMSKLKKGGFWLYAVCNGLFALLMIFGGLPGIITTLVCILFIVLFGMNLKYMR